MSHPTVFNQLRKRHVASNLSDRVSRAKVVTVSAHHAVCRGLRGFHKSFPGPVQCVKLYDSNSSFCSPYGPRERFVKAPLACRPDHTKHRYENGTNCLPSWHTGIRVVHFCPEYPDFNESFT